MLVLVVGAAAAPGAVADEDPDAAGTPPTVHLTLHYDSGPGAARTATVRCGRKAAATGWLRTTPARACRVARARAALLTDAPPADEVCAQVYGGPETARVSGRVGGRPVERRFTRHDGCGIADWAAMRGLLPPASDSGAIPVESP